MKVLIFIDGPNVNHQQQEMRISIKWDSYRDFLAGGREIVEVRYYTTPPLNVGTEGFHTYLRGLGFEVITCKQGEDVDNLILEDLHRLYPTTDVVVLAGGDGVYIDALTEAVNAGKEAEVVCISTMMAGGFSGIAKTIDPITHKDEIIDQSKTRRRQLEVAERASETTPGAEHIGQLMALGTRVSIETRPREIIIRVVLPPNWSG